MLCCLFCNAYHDDVVAKQIQKRKRAFTRPLLILTSVRPKPKFRPKQFGQSFGETCRIAETLKYGDILLISRNFPKIFRVLQGISFWYQLESKIKSTKTWLKNFSLKAASNSYIILMELRINYNNSNRPFANQGNSRELKRNQENSRELKGAQGNSSELIWTHRTQRNSSELIWTYRTHKNLSELIWTYSTQGN